VDPHGPDHPPHAPPPSLWPVGFAVGIAVLLLGLIVGWHIVLLGAILAAATLESVFAFCIGCQIFGLLMRWGVIPDDVCERCRDIWKGRRTPV
jgi:hypothetical protein